jgi:phosphate-selective porin OprO/OprP
MKAIVIVLLLTTAAAAQQVPGKIPIGDAEEPLRRELDELLVRQRELERRLDATQRELQRRDAGQSQPIASSPSLRFSFGREGFVFGTPDGQNEISLHAVLHVDWHSFFGPAAAPPDTFFIRRARPMIKGTLFGIVDFRLMPDFAMGQAVLLDGYLELHPWEWLRLRAGKYRSPFGLEFLQSDSQTHLVERSLVNDLVPLRDIGVMLSGELGRGALSYAIAVFNGAPDGGNAPDYATQTAKDYVARIFITPIRPLKNITQTDLGFGLAASYGSPNGAPNATNLPTYKSTALQPIFTYYTANPMVPDSAAVAAGTHWRISPQLYWYFGPVGVLAEYIFSSQRVQRLGAVGDIGNRAWNVTASFVMTMERASYDGVTPKRPLDFRHLSFGAFELALRYSELRIDPAAFPMFADPALSVRSARELAAGINWHMTEHTKIMFSFQHSDFAGGAPMGGDRGSENALLGRIQICL